MANIQPSIKDWAIVEASNQPDGTDSATIAGDLRALQAGIRYIYSQDTIASATTTDLGSKAAGYLTITGTTTITGLGTVSAGIIKRCVFSGALTLTHNGTSLILPGGANITTVDGDVFFFESLGFGNWKCLLYLPITGGAVTTSNTATLTNKTLTSPTISGGTINNAAIGGGTPAAITGTTITGTDTTDATTSTAGAMKTAGGLAVAKKLFVGTLLDLSTGTAGQVKFPASQNASADANTLDDYEEGTFTPVIASSGGGSATYTTQTGTYTKVGDRVYFSISITLATKGTLAAGNVTITGLPFTVSSALITAYAVMPGSLLTTTAGSVCADSNLSTTVVRLFTFTAGVSALLTVADLAATQILRISGHYGV